MVRTSSKSVSHSIGRHVASLYQIPDNPGVDIEEFLEFPTAVQSVAVSLKDDRALGLADTLFQVLDIQAQSFGTLVDPGVSRPITAGKWDPHSRYTLYLITYSRNLVALASERDVFGWDLVSGSETFRLRGVDRFGVLDLDFNPISPFQIATGGISA